MTEPATAPARLTLHPVSPATARALATGGDGGFTWAGGTPFEGTRVAAGMLVRADEAGVYRPGFGLYVLVRHDDGQALGAMGFHGAPDEDGRVEIGYDLVEAARGRGYATEALRALAADALARPGVRSLFATVEPDNLSSQAVLTRAGFTRADDPADTDAPLLAYELRGGR